ncbi:MAG: D-Ala-D-Ala carboxypeptidase family metallohydrolase [Bacteroidales bacterium]
MRLSKNFTLDELLHSDTADSLGIRNTPSKEVIVNLRNLVRNVLQPAREQLGSAIRVNSGFRCEELNTAIKGAKQSQHRKGEAADLDCKNNAKLYNIIKDNLDFDQLIWEKGDDRQPAWVHVSFKASGNRKQLLRIR